MQKIVMQHIQDGRTLKSLAVEYGVSQASISNWVRSYREECQNDDEAKTQLELMEEVRKLRQEKAELEKENDFLKISKMPAWLAMHSLRRESIRVLSIH